MALSRLLRPLHVGTSQMQCVIEQRHLFGQSHAHGMVDDSSILDAAVNSPGGSGRKNIDREQEVIDKKILRKEACDQHGYLYHKFYYQSSPHQALD